MDNKRVACLDGLRGWASLVVVFSHLLQGILARPPGSSFATVLSSDLVYSSPLYLLMDGVSAVVLFFLISGFSLCIPSFQGRSAADVWKMAVFRPLRLYVPVVIAAMFAYVILAAGLMQNEPLALSTDNSWLANVYRVDPSIGNLLRTFMKLKFKEYNPVFWSMRPELICSLYIFAFLLLAKYTGTRIILHVLAIGISVRAGAFYPAFALGAALADLFVTFENARQSSTRTARHAFETAALVLFAVNYCWWVARPPYQTAPSSVRILPMFLLVVATLSGGWIGKFMSNRLSLVLGRLSFPLYLLHLPIICSLSSFLTLQLLARNWSPDAILALVTAVTLGASLGAAWLFAIFVEEWLLVVLRKRVNRFCSRFIGANEGNSPRRA